MAPRLDSTLATRYRSKSSIWKVVRSTLVRQERRGNETVVIYQTGLEFREPSPEILATLEEVISASRPGGGTPGETTVTFLLMDLPFPPV